MSVGWQILTGFGLFGGILAFSIVLTYLQVAYFEPWRMRFKWRRRLRGMHLVTTSKVLSTLEYPEDGCIRHWFTDDIAVWCYENLSGKYGCVPIFDRGMGDDFRDYLHLKYDDLSRQFFFEKAEEAMMFKLRWC